MYRLFVEYKQMKYSSTLYMVWCILRNSLHRVSKKYIGKNEYQMRKLLQKPFFRACFQCAKFFGSLFSESDSLYFCCQFLQCRNNTNQAVYNDYVQMTRDLSERFNFLLPRCSSTLIWCLLTVRFRALCVSALSSYSGLVTLPPPHGLFAFSLNWNTV